MRRNRILSFVGAGLLSLAASHALAEKAKQIETFTAFGVSMTAGKTSTVAITIERWSTDQERQMLLETLRDKGQKEMVAALGKLPRVGFIRLANTRGYDLHYARETRNTDGSRRVVVAADRVLQFHEVVGGTRSQNYDFGFVELHFPASGKGEGKLAPANLISIDKVTNQIEIENYGTQPIRLMSVTSKTP